MASLLQYQTSAGMSMYVAVSHRHCNIDIPLDSSGNPGPRLDLGGPVYIWMAVVHFPCGTYIACLKDTSKTRESVSLHSFFQTPTQSIEKISAVQMSSLVLQSQLGPTPAALTHGIRPSDFNGKARFRGDSKYISLESPWT